MRHPGRRSRTTILVLAASLAAALSAGCGQARTVEPHAQSVAVEVLPPAADVKPGATQAFSAAVTGTTDTGVTWTIQEASGGSVNASGLYTAPAATGTFHVIVTSTADATASATATVTVTATPSVAITISPATASITAGATRQFTATVTGSSTTTKTWSVVEAGGGTVNASGLYTAPATPGTYHVVATSVADATRTATATVTVTAPVVAVAVSPTTTSVAVGATAQLTASVTGSANTAVTWSVVEAGGGTVSASGLYTPPAATGTYHVKATSQADATRSATATITVTPAVVAGACQPLGLEAGISLSSYLSDRFSWWDDACAKRTAQLVRNNARDPFGDTGGYLRTFTYLVNGATRTVGPMPFGEYAGWGYTVNHYGTGTANANSWSQTGTWRTVYAGAYHAVHEFKFTVQPAGGPIDITIWWTFATGKNNPLVALTHDTSRAGPNAVNCDARGPYGELAIDGATSNPSTVGGVGWGDRFKFILTGAGPLTTKSAWTYNTPNVIPYANIWSQTVDAEMGEVQSQTWTAHVAGSDYGPGQTASCSGSTSASPGSQCYLWDGANSLVANNLWPFQINNWNLGVGSTTTVTRMAWGQTLGSVGQQSVTAWGKTLSGYPYQSYAVYLVLGKHSTGSTAAQVREMESVSRATLTASTGTVVQDGPGGAGRTDAAPYAPRGWDHVLGTWAVTAAGNQATVQLTPAAGDSLPNPVFRLLGWTGGALPTSVTLDGTALTAGTDYFPSLDTSTGALWLTLKRTLTAPAVLAVR